MQKPLEIGPAKRAGRFPLNSNIEKERREEGGSRRKERQRRKRLNRGGTRDYEETESNDSLYV